MLGEQFTEEEVVLFTLSEEMLSLGCVALAVPVW